MQDPKSAKYTIKGHYLSIFAEAAEAFKVIERYLLISELNASSFAEQLQTLRSRVTALRKSGNESSLEGAGSLINKTLTQRLDYADEVLQEAIKMLGAYKLMRAQPDQVQEVIRRREALENNIAPLAENWWPHEGIDRITDQQISDFSYDAAEIISVLFNLAQIPRTP